MRKVILIIIILTIAAIALFAYYQKDAPARTDESKTSEAPMAQYETFSDSGLGLEFSYRRSPLGYVLQDITGGFNRALILFRTEDYENLDKIPEGGEGPAVIAIQIFDNSKNEFPEAWANANQAYSNIHLKLEEVTEVTIGGAKAIRYMADGLYVSENVVITYGDNVYLVTGQFIDADSDLRRDFEPFLNSIRFIPKPGQE